MDDDFYKIIELKKKQLQLKILREAQQRKRELILNNFAIYVDDEFYKAFPDRRTRLDHYKTKKFRKFRRGKEVSFIYLNKKNARQPNKPYEAKPKDLDLYNNIKIIIEEIPNNITNNIIEEADGKINKADA